ncbi:MAG: acylneuraminate cytidylyltransferase family protein [Candidatus Schekmanbacteria bacterium]|nr:acylneuraminate cytidylyltransferase family protein [Candidatus Schekmanbacteria bacterium]
MYQSHKIVCIIPARGGSKGLPGKNIRKLKDKPLIAYSVEQAKSSEYIDRVIVSTDDLKIADIARQYGAEVPFIRPANLAADNSSTIDVLLHVIDWLGESANYLFDILVLLHVTTPLRTVEDIDNCIELLVRENADNVFSVAAAYRNPYFNMVEVTKDGSVSLVKKGDFTTRQSAPKVYDMNASIYVWWKDILKAQKSVFLEKSRVYVMPRERSVDIDDLMDFKIAEMLLKGLVA